MTGDAKTTLHNRVAPAALNAIIRPIHEAGGSIEDVLVVLESVIVGVVLYGAKVGGDEIVVDTIMDGVKARLAEQRLGPMSPAGSA